MKKLLKVVGAIIENKDKEILCALRSPKMSLPNRWEFPGGKIEQGETFKQAIEREIREELSCTVEFIDVFNNSIYEYEKFTVNLITVKCKLISGTPTKNEHSKLIWMPKENLPSLNWAPVDIPTMKKLLQEKV
ncbi:MAG: (deoxy)nucleoside triphosphate pyrophosphohydrolase [Clostridium sp.]|jgi:8-oxo-dGTP diphosphatase|uniref:(deoxy)nucleoside triphosphate pyrophosphohydrolase n=1 Tax=Clostridium sp. TaxID=1506 RepID=UPI0025BD8FDA|nr:(deoxy)nucleoside triphosphate pyrophosphohydrolase [Clostridium sp.]MCH3964463.1 (deoxy)nucleoside triphosphate pyrophosphohydrolase [Clostridium sp.]MCI1715638.1 (deoxy)nucleoside triphosphate pyrophosphohydrolase [Clostridium sp.]MCI1799570.1 (deoxy)nucleoside triphosphate pyrophosphohydrolase [Clostridium sp.]MCI1813822.1 (deoxy)nucleoside triphosphate pyrophosphohydrolase [Clostridium sp.]MCI1870383.1 (deoxy)nucleoside triphosphate pyrophosphohydrolase [Clostridium sp.]